MKILVTGATGFIGKHLLDELIESGFNDFVVLSRGPQAAMTNFDYPLKVISCDLNKEIPTPSQLEGVEAVIHLAGEPVAQRWSDEVKQKILHSREKGTQNLIQGFLNANITPKVFISSSAIGIYGDRQDEELTVESSYGKDFLARVCQKWEAALLNSSLNCRKVCVRTGIVLGEEGGALAQMLPPFKLGAGGPIGAGRQWMSWIHVKDLSRLFCHALQNETLSGPINGVSPCPQNNKTFSQTLAKVLSRPCLFPVPPFMLKLLFGEMSFILLASQKINPQKVLDSGFKYVYSQLKDALEDILKNDVEGISSFRARQWVNKSPEEVFPFFSNEKNLEKITPAFLQFNVLGKNTESMKEGTVIDYKLKIHGMPVKWRSQIESWEPNQKFVDRQVKGPYQYWHHTHLFFPHGSGTIIEDHVRYKVPGGFLGKILAGWYVRKDVENIFRYRKKSIDNIFHKPSA